ncbi:MAG: CBS domain-containing protein [Candidatus Bipolaricaulis sp.]|nr:CBS domain-containing protein [Candidatus Bipolaricaulis sp.]
MNVGIHMQRDAVTALPSTTAETVLKLMDEHGFGVLLVTSEDGSLRGFITRGSLKGVQDGQTPIESIAHPVRFSVSPTDTLEKATLIMLENRLVLLPVTEGDRLVGVITQSAVLRGLADALGIGLEGTRMELRLRAGSEELYRVLEVLRAHQIHIVSMANGMANGERRDVILRVQGIGDREQLRAELEQRLDREPQPPSDEPTGSDD